MISLKRAVQNRKRPNCCAVNVGHHSTFPSSSSHLVVIISLRLPFIELTEHQHHKEHTYRQRTGKLSQEQITGTHQCRATTITSGRTSMSTPCPTLATSISEVQKYSSGWATSKERQEKNVFKEQGSSCADTVPLHSSHDFRPTQ